MKYLMLASILIPVIGGTVFALFWRLSEKWISILSRIFILLTLCSALCLIGCWAVSGFTSVEFDLGALYKWYDYSFPLVFVVDVTSCVYLFLTAILSSVTVKYSRYYLHRERGYRRYFSLILVMTGGSNLLALSGTLDLLFAAWEIIGISSFLLIGFYWRRNQPVRNALVSFTVYRICDVGFLAGTMLTHVLWIDGDRFLAMKENASAILLHAQAAHPAILPIIAALIIFASLGKSAQFPFLNWLTRALEGPTPSSAIFYGALSVHAGAILLIRTEPIWGHFFIMRGILIGVGILSALLATIIGRTLSNIKAQIAYAAIAQLGIIFIEIALGWQSIALIHIVLHSLLRAYQILISPFIVAHALRVLGSTTPVPISISHRLLKFRKSLSSPFELLFYRLSLTDFYLWPSNVTFFLTRPQLAKKLRARVAKLVQIFLMISTALATCCAFSFITNTVNIFEAPHLPFAWFFGVSTVVMGIFIQKKHLNAKEVWIKIGLCFYFEFLVVSFISPHLRQSTLPFFLFLVIGWGLGSFLVFGSANRSLTRFHGLAAKLPIPAFLFFLSLAIIAGIPPSPSFFAEDLLLHSVFEQTPLLSIVLVGGVILTSIATARIFIQLCFGRSYE